MCLVILVYTETFNNKIFRNPSCGSLVISETGSLDRAKAAMERRKKIQLQESERCPLSGRVEDTRVNPNHLIDELLKNTNLEQTDDMHESKYYTFNNKILINK